MIIHSKESGGKESLLDLLGGGNSRSKTKGFAPNDLFAKLLGSLSSSNKLSKEVLEPVDGAFTAIIDTKKAAVKSSAVPSDLSVATKELQALLGNSDALEEPLIAKELLDSMTGNQVRTLIYRAKEHLKTQITEKNPELSNDPKGLPKTLVGLVRLADKLGLEPQTITLSSFADEIPEINTLPAGLLSKPLLEAKAMTKLSTDMKDEDVFEAITQMISERKGKENKTISSKEPILSKPEADAKESLSHSQPLKTLLQSIEKQDLSEQAPNTDLPETADNKPRNVSTVKSDVLITLLQGDASAKETKSEKSGSVENGHEPAKTFQAPQADSFEVKTKEAQQSMRLFATDLKEAVENYKPPFTRISMKLNPEKLGEVEVTLIQRGNNVHVNIQSTNTNSVAFLAHNATELKAQLAHQGITNATMNFMAGGDGQTQQQQHQQHQNHFRTYQSFEELELNEEQLSALELIIPHYA